MNKIINFKGKYKEMIAKEIKSKFAGGFVIGKDYKTIELLLNKQNTKDNALYLDAYDSNLMPLPPFQKWNKNKIIEVENELIKKVEKYNIDVFIDGVQIQKRCK